VARSGSVFLFFGIRVPGKCFDIHELNFSGHRGDFNRRHMTIMRERGEGISFRRAAALMIDAESIGSAAQRAATPSQ